MNKKKLFMITTAALISVNLTACSVFKAKSRDSVVSNKPQTSDTKPSNSSGSNNTDKQSSSNTATQSGQTESGTENISDSSSTAFNSTNSISTSNNSSTGGTSSRSAVSGSAWNNVGFTWSDNDGDTDNSGDEDDSVSSDWKLVWNDEFNEKNLDTSKWGYDIGNCIVDSSGNKVTDGWGNNEKEYYTDSTNNVYLQGGKLNIKANKETVTDQFGDVLNYTSGKIKTLGKFSKKYGRIDVKAKLPQGKGFWPAIWMLPESDVYGGWAASGEIDLMEAWGSQPGKVAGTLHYGSTWPNNTYTGKQFNFPAGTSINNDFHTYSLEWEPGEIRWYVDGNLYQTQNNWYTKGAKNEEKYSFPAPFDQNFYIILNLAVGGNWDGEPDETTQFQEPMKVDYVRVYDLVGRPYKTPVEPSINAEPLPSDAKITTEDGNYIYNGYFKTNDIQENADGSKAFGTGWNFVHIPDAGGNGSVLLDTINGTSYAKVNITSAGTKDYSVQLIQQATLGKGRWYKLSYDSKTDTARQIGVKMSGGADRGWTAYTDTYTESLTKDFQHFEKTFQMQRDTDSNARLEFELGLNTSPVWIGNVRLEQIPAPAVDYNASKTPLSDGNRIYNGTFDKGNIDRMTYWNFSTNAAEATAKVPEDTRELTSSIINCGNQPDAITLYQKGIQLSKDNDYKLTFKSRADLPRTIKVGILNKDGSVSYIDDQTIDLTTSMNEHTVAFKMQQATDAEAQVVFKLGGNYSDVYIDDVSLIQTSNAIDYSQVALYPLKNGDFANGLESWKPYPNIGDGADSVITADNRQAKISINKTGPNPWSLMLNQEGLKFSKGVEYVIGFDVRATAARNMEVVIDNSAYTRYLSEKVEAPAGNEMKHYEYTLKLDKDDTVNLKFLMGKTDDTVPASQHDIYIDNVKCEVKDAKFISSVVKNGTFDGTLEPWQSWTGDGGAADALITSDGVMKIAVNNAGPNSWSVQEFQEGLKLEKGQKYSVSFKAKADQARKMNINIGKALTADPWYKAFADTQIIDLTDTMKEYSFEFTMNEDTYDNGKMVFELGNVTGGNAATNVYIDDVAINKVADSSTDNGGNTGNPGGTISTGTSLIQNGTFDNGINNWIHFKADWDGAYSTFAVENGEAKVHIDYEGPQNWSTQLAQEGLNIEKGRTYVLSFDAKSSIARNIQAIIEQNGGAYTKYLEPQVVALTGDMQHYTYEFTMNSDTDPSAHLVFALGKIDGNASPLAPHDIFIDNVVIAEK